MQKPNVEAATRWVWLLSGSDVIYQTIRYRHNEETAKAILDKQCYAIVITDQCGSYNWLDPTRHQFWWAHVTRNLQQISEYSDGGLTSHIGKCLILFCHTVFQIQHCYE